METLAPYCRVCGTALEGPAGRLFSLFGIRRSARNPNLCNRCGTHLEDGRIVELTVFFADVVSFTQMTAELGAERTYEVIEAFFQKANHVLVEHDAFIDKYMGDAVMAIFNAPIQSKNHAQNAVAAAVELQAGLQSIREQFDLDFQVRVGIASGFARVGRIGSQDRKDYTAIGDVVNLAARLEGQARPGEILIDGAAYDQIVADFPDIPAEYLPIRGFKEAIRAHRIQLVAGVRERIQEKHAPDGFENRQMMGAGSILFAILGAPCAAAAILGPLSVAVGLGSLMGAISPALGALDQSPVRWSLQLLALLGAAVNLYVIWYGYRLRQRARLAGNEVLSLTRLERRRVWLVAGLSVVTLLVVVSELYAHVFITGAALI